MRRKKTHCEWCGHEISYIGVDVPHFYYNDNASRAFVLCAECFYSDDADMREMVENIMAADVEFFGEYKEDDF